MIHPFRHLARAGLFLLALAAPGFAAPRAQVEPATIELGIILEGNEFERFLTVTNVGDEVLVIEDVKTSCGCTAAGIEGSVELNGGESKEIRVTFNSRNMDGDVTKKVTVFTNDPDAGTSVVEIKANVHQPVRFLPRYLSLDRVGHRDEYVQSVSLQADAELGLEVKDAYILGGRLNDKASKMFDLEVGSVYREDERDVVDFEIRLRPDQNPGRLSETLIVVTNLPATRDTMKLSIRGELIGRINVKPAFAVLRLADPGQETVRDVMLTAEEGTFRVVSAEVPESTIGVEVFEQEGGKQTMIRLRYVGEEEGTSGVKTLKIVTDDPHQNNIEVPVRYHTRAARKATAQTEEG